VVVGLGEKLDLAGPGQGVEGAQHLRTELLELFQQHPRQAEGDLEAAVPPADQVQEEPVRGQVTLVGDLAADGGVLVVVEVVGTAVKNRIVAESLRLVDLEVHTH